MVEIILSKTQSEVLGEALDEHIHYTYPINNSKVIKDINENIEKGKRCKVNINENNLEKIREIVEERIDNLEAHTGPAYDDEERKSKIASLASILTKKPFQEN